MKYTTKRNVNTLTITFKMTQEEWADFDKRAYEQNKGKYNIPGFRKGHVPKNILENRYGKGLFFEDALYIAAQEYYTAFLDKNKKVLPVARPAIDEKSVKIDEKGVSFAVVVTVRPEVVLGQYKGLTIEKTPVQEVKDQDIDAELDKVVQRNARFVEITDRAVAEGDQVNLDYCGKVNGVAFEGGTAEKQSLTIGSHTFIPGFEEQLVGMAIGETKDITVTFPEEYHAEELAGKEAVFTCTINGITVKELPTLDDDFAQDVSEFSTMEEYRADIARIIGERYTKDAENADESKLVETIVEAAQFELPEEMVEEQIDNYVEDFKYQLMYQGLDIDSYFKYTNSTMEDLRAQHKDRATKAVRTRLVFEEIVKAEKIKATAKQINEKIKEYAERNGSTYEDFNAQLRPEDRYYFENQVITEALLALLKKENTIA
ncbi:MAG: trigger factor [Clostridia bacterium]|nr:trigger factor [Clostridia bacterium]MBQ7914994.1 trigger factor [Clostridia bacterium]MBQ8505453.1 trigger factor [Clostridia bacterium]MBQ8873264.1 trigger factor [Clostridia bacterium]MBQ9706340.1 trigger factor [Clostridia bacterium]